jgi:serine phosphatase RsbU (regulator of sigma subunit)
MWAISVPAGYVGGDLYDVIPLADGSLIAYVADISGKGVPAALLMAALSTTIRNATQIETEIDRLMASVNDSMHRLMADEGYFATAVLIRYWPLSGRLQYVLAGHIQPLWLADSGICDLPAVGGVSLGIEKGAIYQKGEIVLESGQSVLLFTDGLVEAENDAGEHFTKSRLADYLETCAQRRPLGSMCSSASKPGAANLLRMMILPSWRCGGRRPKLNPTMPFRYRRTEGP